MNSEGLLVLDHAKASKKMILFTLFILGCFPNAVLLCAPALSNQLILEYSLTTQQVGYFFSLEFCGYAIAGLLGVYLLQRFDRKLLLKYGVFFFIAGNLLSLFFSDNITLLMCVRALTAIFGGCFINLLAMSFSGSVENSSRAYACYILGQLTFGVVGLFCYPLLFSLFGLKIFFVTISIFAISIFPLMKYLPEMAKETSQTVTDKKAPLSVMLTGLIVIFLFYLSLVGLWTFVGEIAKSIQISDIQIGFVLSISTAGGMVGSACMAYLSGKVRISLAIAVGLFIMILSIMGFTIASGFALFFISAILFKFAWTFVIPAILEVVSDVDPSGRVLSFASSGIGIGMMLGPIIASWLITSFHGFNGMLFCSAIFCLFSWFGCLSLFKALKKNRAQP